MLPEQVVEVERVLDEKDATKIVGSQVGTELKPTFRSPADGTVTRLVADGETVALVTRLAPDLRAGLRQLVTGMRHGNNVARHSMSGRGSTFGYLPRKPMALQEGCRLSVMGRDNPTGEALLERIADTLSHEFEQLMPTRAVEDRAEVDKTLLRDWRMGEHSLWTSGVINQMNVLPYHRDGNNLPTWSAMPTVRYGCVGAHLHLPEYNTVFPCSDGDVTWFYGRRLVHGVTPLKLRRKDGYRYSVVFYALKGLANCATYAEETARVAERRTIRERTEAAKLRAELIERAARSGVA